MMANNYKSATIYSFEPDQITFEILKKNTSSENNVKIYNFGLGEKTDFYNMYIDPKDSGDNTLLPIEGRDFIKIQIKTFDEFIEINKIKNVKFIKIDIQGYEVQFLIGAKKSINKYRPIIMIEVMDKYIKIRFF